MYINSEYWKGKYKILKKLFSHNVARIILYYEFNNMKVVDPKFKLEKLCSVKCKYHIKKEIHRKVLIYEYLRYWRLHLINDKKDIIRYGLDNSYGICDVDDDEIIRHYFFYLIQEEKLTDLIDYHFIHGLNCFDENGHIKETEEADDELDELDTSMENYYLKSIIY